ncbi:hypothetical protein ACFQ4X_06960 [Fictibacillus halophilus]|uniref:hypothetical protein n=1 Tax=Fictibacillus halophilus TaxID=1610490 RepID=UPI003631067B
MDVGELSHLTSVLFKMNEMMYWAQIVKRNGKWQIDGLYTYNERPVRCVDRFFKDHEKENMIHQVLDHPRVRLPLLLC